MVHQIVAPPAGAAPVSGELVVKTVRATEC